MGNHTEKFKPLPPNKAQSLKGAMDVLEKQKRNNIALAQQNPSGCVVIAVLILATIIALPGAGMLLFLV